VYLTLFSSKIDLITATQFQLHYHGSFAIGEDLLNDANLIETEHIHIWNINNRERFVTYAIKG
jgi:aspartate 1-decarboxylase